MDQLTFFIQPILNIYQDDRCLWFSIYAVLFSIISYIILALPYLIIDHLKITRFNKYRIETKTNKNLGHKSIFLFILNSILLFCLSVIFWPLLSLSQINLSPFPGFIISILQILFFLMLDDLLFYFYHRHLHSPFLYHKVHRIHHSYRHSSVLAAIHFHPIEYILISLSFYSGPLLLGANVWVFYMWIFLRQWIGVSGHCGYKFPWEWQKHIPFHSGNQFHYLHHKYPNRNFGLFFDLWDRIFSTRFDS
ncbi:MAG: sterol desaturase family protein [Leptospira sp.]|nr:sterol desaturase family protein [Leptospira sp.]